SPRDTPDSPEGAQQPPHTSVPASSGSSSGSSKGSPPASGMGVLNGSSPPGSVNGAGSGDSPSPPGTAISTPAPVAAPALLLEARQLAKMRRFLTTIVQFGSDVSAETGDRVRSLVLALVSNSLGVEEFQRALQAAFNFPLRPFVLPFLRAGIPALQREVAALARHAKQVRHTQSSAVPPAARTTRARSIVLTIRALRDLPLFGRVTPRVGGTRGCSGRRCSSSRSQTSQRQTHKYYSCECDIFFYSGGKPFRK
ncbi:hypothetical protein B566_EDAN001311, partial [Ephemera danica]